jgi:hypothetical protein
MNDQPGINMLQKEIGIDTTEVAARKAFLEFVEADAALAELTQWGWHSHHPQMTPFVYKFSSCFASTVEEAKI